jgi:diguanylate cyclase (GGDEF)-like protein
MKELSERKLTIAYIFALGLIGFLTIASHLTLNRVMAAHEGSAAIVNISGRQRMLSQRIASLAAQIRLGVPEAKAELLRAADQFEAAHRKLVAESNAISGGSGVVVFRDLYAAGDHPLDAEVAAYLRLARAIAGAPAGTATIDPQLAALFAEARAPLLSRLDQVVQLHQAASEAQLARLQLLQRFTMVVVLVALAAEALLIFRPMVRQIARYARELQVLANVDSLTGALNRRAFVERGDIEQLRARRSGATSAMLMIDADHFRQINDSFGHAGGDSALRALGQALRGALRPGDLLGRLGGEEFAVLLPRTSRDGAGRLAERLRAAIAGLSIDHAGRPIRMTVSIGVAGDRQAELADLLRDADAALYVAKNTGRNRVSVGQ